MKKVEVKEVGTSRRSFLKISGITLAGAGLLLAGCSSDDDSSNNDNQLPGVRGDKFDLGGGDLGILTYAYALEQLEADFYTQVVNHNSFGVTFLPEEQAVLADLYAHEVIHREFFKTALTNALQDDARVLPTLQFTYASVNFGNKQSVLNTAKVLEDTGVSAYNGAGRYIQDSNYLLIAGKIVSVEARHASAIRSLLNPGTASFAGNDVVSTDHGLDMAEKPSVIIPRVAATNFIQTPFTANFLP